MSAFEGLKEEFEGIEREFEGIEKKIKIILASHYPGRANPTKIRDRIRVLSEKTPALLDRAAFVTSKKREIYDEIKQLLASNLEDVQIISESTGGPNFLREQPEVTMGRIFCDSEREQGSKSKEEIIPSKDKSRKEKRPSRKFQEIKHEKTQESAKSAETSFDLKQSHSAQNGSHQNPVEITSTLTEGDVEKINDHERFLRQFESVPENVKGQADAEISWEFYEKLVNYFLENPGSKPLGKIALGKMGIRLVGKKANDSVTVLMYLKMIKKAQTALYIPLEKLPL